MARTSKLYLSRGIPKERYAQITSGADDVDLMILGAILLGAGEDGQIDLPSLESLGRFDSSDVAASVKYWKGAGVLCAQPQAVSKYASDEQNTETAHKDGAITHTSVEKYTNEQLAAVLGSRVGTAFVDEAQKAMGKMFNNGEVGKLVGMVDQLGFEEEAVLAILSYCVRLGKKSLSYAEKIAVTFHDDDIFTAEAVHAQIDLLEKRNNAIEKVKNLFGFGGRALSATEKKLFAAWTENYGFGMDIITKAYDLTVDAIQVPAPKYTDKILTKWHERGLTTVAEIDAFIAEERSSASVRTPRMTEATAKKQAKNAELDEWFDMVLEKSLGE